MDTAEIRSKMREDRVDESDENSGRSMNPDEVDNSDEEVSGSGDETDDQVPIKKERSPSPTIESAPWLHKDDQYERRTEAAQDTGEVPTSEHSGGAHDMVQDEADEGETDTQSANGHLSVAPECSTAPPTRSAPSPTAMEEDTSGGPQQTPVAGPVSATTEAAATGDQPVSLSRRRGSWIGQWRGGGHPSGQLPTGEPGGHDPSGQLPTGQHARSRCTCCGGARHDGGPYPNCPRKGVGDDGDGARTTRKSD